MNDEYGDVAFLGNFMDGIITAKEDETLDTNMKYETTQLDGSFVFFTN